MPNYDQKKKILCSNFKEDILNMDDSGFSESDKLSFRILNENKNLAENIKSSISSLGKHENLLEKKETTINNLKVELKKALDTIVNFESKENILNEKIKTLENSLTKNKKKLKSKLRIFLIPVLKSMN